MDLFVPLLVLALIAAIPTGLVLVLVAWSRLAELQRRVRALEQQVRSAARAEFGVAPAEGPVEAPPVGRATPAAAPPAPPTRERADVERVREPQEVRPASQPVPYVAVSRPTVPSAAPPAHVERAAAPAAPAPRPAADWERLLGIRGAAILGGAVLALAGLLFVQYSISRGWIGPAARCSIAGVVGCAAILGSMPLRARGYTVLSDTLAGAGATILYGAAWAAHVLYGLVPLPLAMAAMAAVTVLCGYLATRRSSQTIALFGVCGGFSTPLVLSLGARGPIGLIAYLLLLQAAVQYVARERRWHAAAVLGAIATPLVFVAWIAFRFEPQFLPHALVFCALSSLVQAFLAGDRPGFAPLIGVLAPFPIAAWLATWCGERSELPASPIGLAFAVAVLGAGAAWTAVRSRRPALLPASAAGGAVVLGTWLATADVGAADAWIASAAVAGLAAILHVSAERAQRLEGTARPAWGPASGVALVILAVPLVIGAVAARRSGVATDAVSGASPVEPWLLGCLAPCAALVLRSRRDVRVRAAAAAALIPAALFVVWRHAHESAPADFGAVRELAIVAALGSAALAAIRLVRSEHARIAALSAAVITCVLLVERIWAQPLDARSRDLVVLSTAVLAAIGWLSARSARSAAAPAVVALAAAVVQLRWTAPFGLLEPPGTAQLAVTAATAVAFVLGPALDRNGLGALAGAWRVAAISAGLWTLSIDALVEACFEKPPDAAAPALTGALAAIAALLAHRRRSTGGSDASVRAPAIGLAWTASAAAVLFAIAFADTVGRAEHLVVTALACAATAVLSRRLDHGGLRLVSLSLAPLTLLFVLLLLAHAARSGNHLRSGYPVVHWLSYETGLPALALLTATWMLRGAGEPASWLSRRAAGVVGLAAVVGVFLWLNVEVVNLASHGPSYDLGLDRRPGRDVALSVAWSAYAFTLLAIGAARRVTLLRWTSLVFFVATIGKVFLYDLGELRGLHRVGSLVGIALSLLLVSWCYQRFVFGGGVAVKRDGAESASPP